MMALSVSWHHQLGGKWAPELLGHFSFPWIPQADFHITVMFPVLYLKVMVPTAVMATNVQLISWQLCWELHRNNLYSFPLSTWRSHNPVCFYRRSLGLREVDHHAPYHQLHSQHPVQLWGGQHPRLSSSNHGFPSPSTHTITSGLFSDSETKVGFRPDLASG